MKKVFCFVLVLITGFVLMNNQYSLPVVSAQSDAGQTGKISANQIESDRKLAAKIRQLTNRSTDGLTETRSSDGEVSLDLDDRFQNVMLSKIGKNGEPAAACVTSLDEANTFFGKDLETGAPIFSTQYETDDTATVAARHGIPQGEFEFYKKLIADAAARRANNLNAASIVIINGDAAGEGFNDVAAKTTEGGNDGATLGAQRLNLFNFAAGIWGAYLDSSVTISVNAQFNTLPCSSTAGSSSTLGSAGSATISRDFPNAPFQNTWYHTALASKLSGVDRNAATAEINATFNSDIDNDCRGVGRGFYYGLDNLTPAGRTNLLVVLLHELGHGLGFSSFVNGSTGQLAGNDTNGRYPDIFTRFMFDRTLNKYWHQMTDTERQTSAFNIGNVLWDGANVRIASGFLTSGREASTGRVQLFAPDPFRPGGSISHWDTATFPNLLMEPNITNGLPLTLDLTRQQMRDIGWYRDTTADLIPDTITNVQPSGASLVAGTSATVTWTNTGGFNRNVTIELSTDGGATYSVLASNIANTGSYTFTVPTAQTTQALVRVREYDFAEPAGGSTNFSIGATTAVNRTKFDFDGDGKADLSIFRPTNGTWYLQQSANGFTGVQFGLSTDKIVPADYDGDGKTDIAVFRDGTWYLQRSQAGFIGFAFGDANDIPQPADFDGDGKAELAVYRPSNGTWYVMNLANNAFNAVQFGAATDKPVAADYDGDGKADYGVYRPENGTWYLLRSTQGLGAIQFGISTDKPVVGDYDGDGKADVAAYRQSNGTWYLLNSTSGFSAVQFGVAEDRPTPADYDGDGKTDISVFRPSNGTWYQLRSTTAGFFAQQFGSSGDLSAPNAYVR
ncbi:MAG TPA: FG-GAP-like repeat-containing protein [Pyrinomonadaceae bacterium]|nr:FG-GAP-like repeat-containing protein [Pyrinomonadaceae bacterium]